MNRITPEVLYRLLPAVHRLRDADEGGPLKALVAVLSREGAVVEENIEQLLDNFFIETCADWAAPYIGGTIGYRALYRVEGTDVGNRAEVANTIGYRRRKGTAARWMPSRRSGTVPAAPLRSSSTTTPFPSPGSRPATSQTTAPAGTTRRIWQFRRPNSPRSRAAIHWSSRPMRWCASTPNWAASPFRTRSRARCA